MAELPTVQSPLHDREKAMAKTSAQVGRAHANTLAKTSLDLSLNQPKNLRDEQKAATRRRLIRCAVKLFHKRGYKAVTVENIVAEANASRTTFYWHFKNKADLANHIGADMLAPHTIQLFNELDALARPSREDLLQWLNKVAEFRRKNRAVFEATTEANTIDPALASGCIEYAYSVIEKGMPNYLGRYKGAERERAHSKLVMLAMQLDRFFFFTKVRDIALPYDNEMDALADIWISVLFR